MGGLSQDDLNILAEMRRLSPAESIPTYASEKLGERIADKVTATIGSWRFLIIQSVLLIVWLMLNIMAFVHHWDPYPFILLNLLLSFQAAYTAPVIMMSQNRQNQIDRQKLDYYYNVNVKEELEIKLLHIKINAIMEKLAIDPALFETIHLENTKGS
jgi:uncharacterized membrane protein